MDRDDFIACDLLTPTECSAVTRMSRCHFEYCHAAYRDALLCGYGCWFL